MSAIQPTKRAHAPNHRLANVPFADYVLAPGPEVQRYQIPVMGSDMYADLAQPRLKHRILFLCR